MAFASSCRQGIIPIKAKGKGFGSQALSYVLIGRFPCSRTEPGISTVIRNFDFSTAPSSLASYYQLMCPEVGGGGFNINLYQHLGAVVGMLVNTTSFPRIN